MPASKYSIKYRIGMTFLWLGGITFGIWLLTILPRH